MEYFSTDEFLELIGANVTSHPGVNVHFSAGGPEVRHRCVAAEPVHEEQRGFPVPQAASPAGLFQTQLSRTRKGNAIKKFEEVHHLQEGKGRALLTCRSLAHPPPCSCTRSERVMTHPNGRSQASAWRSTSGWTQAPGSGCAGLCRQPGPAACFRELHAQQRRFCCSCVALCAVHAHEAEAGPACDPSPDATPHAPTAELVLNSLRPQ